jgi:hypothetical protein
MALCVLHENYDLHCFGPCSPSKIQFRYNPGDTLTFSPAAISEKKSIIRTLLKAGKKVEIRPLYRYLSHTEHGSTINFDLGYTDFGEYLLTDIAHPEWNFSQRRAIMSHPLSITTVTISSDHLLLFGYRSQKVISEPGKLQTLPSGYIHPPDSVRTTIEQELFEELAVKKIEIEEVQITGLVQLHPSEKPEILLTVRLNIPASVVFARHGMDQWEFTRFLTLKESQATITDFLQSHADSLAPASHAALACFALHSYGRGSVPGAFSAQSPNEEYMRSGR